MLRGDAPFLFEGPITRTVEDAALALTALAGYDPRDPYSLDEQVDFTAATRRSIRDWKIAYSPDFDVFPMDRRVTDVVGRAVKAFEEAGAHVEQIKVGIKRPQKELSDLWCRLIMPLNVQTFEIIKRAASICSRTTGTTFRQSTCAGSMPAIGCPRSIFSRTRRCAPRSTTPSRAC